MKSEKDTIIRSDHEDASVHVAVESDGFVPGYQRESLTQITVPDLPDDAAGMSAEALAKVPTLTEQVSAQAPPPELAPAPHALPTPEPAHADVPADGPGTSVEVTHHEASVPQVKAGDVLDLEPTAHETAAQDTPPAAESWVELCQVRIDQLSDEIQKLNDRLDQLEQTTKV